MKPIHIILVVVTLSLAAPSVLAQQKTNNGTPAYSSFGGGPDVINEGTLNIHYTLPVFARAGRGIPFSLSLAVDNGAWYRYLDNLANYRWGLDLSTAQPAGALAIGAVYYTYTGWACNDGIDPPYTVYVFTTVSYTGPDNTSHPLSARVWDDNCGGKKHDSPTSVSPDGSGISITIAYNGSGINGTVTLPNGTVIKPPMLGSKSAKPNGDYTVTDINGNQITTDTSNGQLVYISDTLGPQPITSSGVPPNPVYYNYTAPSGAQASVIVTYKTIRVQSAWGCAGVAEYTASQATLIDKVTLPDGTYYQFSYEPTAPGSGNTTGRITQVHLPTAGIITYNYTGGDTGKGFSCVDGSTTGFDRVTSDGTWKYRRVVNSYDPTYNVLSATTTITDPSPQASQTVVDTYQGFVEQRRVYPGTQGGTPLEQVITCYNGIDPINYSACPGQGAYQPFKRVTTYRSLNGGPYSHVDTFYNSTGNLVTKKDDYDWGATAYTRETQIAYDTTLGNGIVDHPSTVKVYDGSGDLKAETDYSYDDFAIPGDTKTCAPATKCRGNLTKLTKYASSSKIFTTQMTYNLTGTAATSTDPNGTTVTTYTYASGACNSSFPTQTQVTSGTTTLTTSATYNCTGAVPTSSTDANGKTTSTSYTDPYFWRPYSSTDELNNVTTYTYTGQTQVESVMNLNANRSTVAVLNTRDAFGRPVYTQRRQGVGSSYFDSVQYVYDSVGRPYETSMPYQATAGYPPGSPIYTTASYDAMMRATKVQDGGGGIVNTVYSQNDVYQEIAPAPTGSNEHTKRKQLEYDGLGRLASVCEVTSDTRYGGACGQTTGGYSGYLTTYVYDSPAQAFASSLTVTQNGQPNGGTSQTRIYQYDALGRLTYESNPETGVNQYFYDSLTGDATCGTVSFLGDLVKTIDNKGLVACLSYDGLHRVTKITYSTTTPPTPTKIFVYESAVVNGATMGLTAGRLAEAYTCTSCPGTKITDVGFTYSERGELKDVYESTPHSGGYYHVSASYWEHGALKSLTGPSLPTIYYGGSDGSGLDGEGRVTKVTTSSGQSPIANNVIYTTSGTAQPIGSLTSVSLGSGDSDAFGYDTLTGRLINYTFNMNSSVAKSGGLTWNANGSLGQVALTDNLTPGNTQTCSYSHDDLGRIASASCLHNSTIVWGQTFSFDPFGNITKNATAGTTFLPTYNMATNQYLGLPGCTPSYDGDGNLTNDCSYNYTWLADGTLAIADEDASTGIPVSMTYDALGRAVEQARGTSYTEIVYTPGGGKLALMNGTTVQKGFIPLPGGGTAVYNSMGLAYYRHSDWLGSSRLATTTVAPTSVHAEAEYAPYGEPYGTSGTLDLNFTGQNQDISSSQNGGLYDFLFREYNPQHGRWISPDPAGMGAVSLGSPQTWNRYAYVGNGPLTAVDPLGLRDWLTFSENSAGQPKGRGPGMTGNPMSCITDPGCTQFNLDIGAAWLSYQTQQFKIQNRLNSPIEQGLTQHLGRIPGYSVEGGHLYASSSIKGTPYWTSPDDMWHFPSTRVNVDLGPAFSGGGTSSDSWLWTATKSFFTGFSVFGPKKDPRPSCFGNFLKNSGANFVGVPGVDTVGTAATAHYGVSQSLAQAVPNTRALRGGISPKQWLAADEAARVSNAGKFSLLFNADVAMAQAFFQNELPAALAGECK